MEIFLWILKILACVLLGLLALLLVALIPRVNLRIRYTDDLSISLRYLLFRFPLYPRKKKKVPLRKYSEKALKKRAKKEEKKGKKEKPSVPAPENPAALTLPDKIGIVNDTVRVFFSRFSRALHVRWAKIDLAVATGDAASTALLYTAVRTAVAALLSTLDAVTNLDRIGKSEIRVVPDYLSEKTRAAVDITLSLRPYRALGLAIATGFRALRSYFTKKKKRSSLSDKKET